MYKWVGERDKRQVDRQSSSRQSQRALPCYNAQTLDLIDFLVVQCPSLVKRIHDVKMQPEFGHMILARMHHICTYTWV